MIIIFLFQFLLSFILFKLFILIPQKYKILDKPNNFFSEQNNTTTSGGIIFLIVAILSLFFFFFNFSQNIYLPNNYLILICGFFFLGFFSFYDDLKPINPIIKLSTQFLICYLCLTSLQLHNFPLPYKLVILFSVLIWVYIINISNFVDGSDGFLSIISLQYFLSILFFFYFNNIENNLTLVATCTISSSLFAFLFFNKPLAQLYMGDVGSIAIGFIIGYSFLEFIINNNFSIVLSSFAYPITDCTITLLKKIKDGHLPWARLFDYYFLKPIKINILNKNKVFKLNLLCNLIIFLITLFIIIFDVNFLFLLSYLTSFIFMNIYKKLT